MVADFDVPVTIVGVPTVREADGLALSSRNVRLNAHERTLAPRLYQALQAANAPDRARRDRRRRGQAARPSRSSAPTTCSGSNTSRSSTRERLQPVETIAAPVLIAGALWVGGTRLIDNCQSVPPPPAVRSASAAASCRLRCTGSAGIIARWPAVPARGIIVPSAPGEHVGRLQMRRTLRRPRCRAPSLAVGARRTACAARAPGARPARRHHRRGRHQGRSIHDARTADRLHGRARRRRRRRRRRVAARRRARHARDRSARSDQHGGQGQRHRALGRLGVRPRRRDRRREVPRRAQDRLERRRCRRRADRPRGDPVRPRLRR